MGNKPCCTTYGTKATHARSSSAIPKLIEPYQEGKPVIPLTPIATKNIKVFSCGKKKRKVLAREEVNFAAKRTAIAPSESTELLNKNKSLPSSRLQPTTSVSAFDEREQEGMVSRFNAQSQEYLVGTARGERSIDRETRAGVHQPASPSSQLPR